MKRKNIIAVAAAALVIILAVVLISRYLTNRTPTLLQGTVECTTYKASSKVPGRIDCMKVSQGDRVEKGQLLYVLSTPELDAKLQQAEAVKSAASALDAAAIAGARIQQIQAALNMWEKAQAGLELARKTYERVKNLYDQGVVPAQKLDEASANYEAMKATAQAARAQYTMARDGARKEDKEAAAAKVRQAEGAVSEVESYISDAMVYSPVTGEVST
ncbi:MAG: biotin/lipoyl-binding protein, partial [Alistipes sp.]|nr:biotin/lipoyl-binding protein [Alistipes sp.]